MGALSFLEASQVTGLTICIICYLFVVRCFRYQRAELLQKRFGTSRNELAKMTVDDAHSILKDLTELEFPKIMGFSVIFALFKTYGVPSISSLLVATGQLSDNAKASKRTADTGVLLLEFVINKPSSDRAIKAITRMNYLHERYQKAGKISNSDMLYTLSLFALEPVRWIEKFEWRSFTMTELCAVGTFWKAMGDNMSISWEELPSYHTGWRDGVHWLEEVRIWSLHYEAANVVPANANHKLACAQLDILLLNIPSRLVLPGKKIISVLLGERLRKAMLLPEASTTYRRFINGSLCLRKLILRHLMLPRPEFMRKSYISKSPIKGSSRYNSKEYLSYPWYIKPTFWSRWGPDSWLTRLLGRKLPGDDGDKYMPEGYDISQVGPSSNPEKEAEGMHRVEMDLRSRRRSGCPFHV